MGADWSWRAPSSPAARAHAPSARWCREARALSASPRSSRLLLDLHRFSRVCSGTQRSSRFRTSYLHLTYLLRAISSGNVCTMLLGFHVTLYVLSLLLILHPVHFPLISMMIPFVNNLLFLFPSTPYLSISLCLCLCVSLSLSLSVSVSISYLCPSVSWSLSLSLSLYLCLPVSVSASLSLPLFLCLCVSLSVSISRSLFLPLSLSVSVSLRNDRTAVTPLPH